MELERLYQQLAELESDDFYQIESDFCQVLSEDLPETGRPACVIAFLVITDWFAKSQGSGVWTFYEAGDPEEIETALQFLKESENQELADIFAYGIHDYQNPKYAEQFDYPEEWIEESDKIDDWIEENEAWLNAWQRNLLLENRELICSFQSSDL